MPCCRLQERPAKRRKGASGKAAAKTAARRSKGGLSASAPARKTARTSAAAASPAEPADAGDDDVVADGTAEAAEVRHDMMHSMLHSIPQEETVGTAPPLDRHRAGSCIRSCSVSRCCVAHGSASNGMTLVITLTLTPTLTLTLGFTLALTQTLLAGAGVGLGSIPSEAGRQKGRKEAAVVQQPAGSAQRYSSCRRWWAQRRQRS